MATLAGKNLAQAGPALDNRRVAAAAIDLLAPVAVLGALAAAGALTAAIAAVVLAWSLFYFFAFESGDGRTPGKRVMGLQAVSADGGALSMRQAAIRTVARVADLPLVGLVVMMATKDRRQRLGDLAAGTMVASSTGVTEPAPPAPAEVPTPAVPDPTVPLSSPVPSEPEVVEVPEAEVEVVEEPVAEPDVVEAPEVEVVEEPVAEPEVVEEPVSDVEPEADVVDATEPNAAPDADVAEPTLTVKPVETVSAMDLIMGDEPTEVAPDETGN